MLGGSRENMQRFPEIHFKESEITTCLKQKKYSERKTRCSSTDAAVETNRILRTLQVRGPWPSAVGSPWVKFVGSTSPKSSGHQCWPNRIYYNQRDNQGFDMIQCSQQSVKTTILLSYRSQCISQLPIQKRSKRHKIITSYHQFTKRYEKYLYVIVCTCSPKIPSSWFPYGSHQERQLSSLFRRLFGASAAWTRQGHVGHVTHFPNGSVWSMKDQQNDATKRH